MSNCDITREDILEDPAFERLFNELGDDWVDHYILTFKQIIEIGDNDWGTILYGINVTSETDGQDVVCWYDGSSIAHYEIAYKKFGGPVFSVYGAKKIGFKVLPLD